MQGKNIRNPKVLGVLELPRGLIFIKESTLLPELRQKVATQSGLDHICQPELSLACICESCCPQDAGVSRGQPGDPPGEEHELPRPWQGCFRAFRGSAALSGRSNSEKRGSNATNTGIYDRMSGKGR